jgi:hypothetical protein
MNMIKTRKRAANAAVAAASAGVLFIILIGAAFIAYRPRLDLIAQHDQSQATVASLVEALNAAAFGICPALCVILIVLGFSILYFLRQCDVPEGGPERPSADAARVGRPAEPLRQP